MRAGGALLRRTIMAPLCVKRRRGGLVVGLLWQVRVVAFPKCRCGVAGRPRWSQSRCPVALPGLLLLRDGVGEHGAIHDVGEPSFEAAHGLHGRLAGGFSPVEIGPPLSGVTELNHRHHVKGAVDLSVPGPGEPVASVVPGGGVQGRRAVPGCEVVPVGEPVDVADLDQQPGRGRRPDAMQVHQGGAGLDDELLDLLVEGLGALIDLLQVTDQFERDPFAGLARPRRGVGRRRAGPVPGQRKGPSSRHRG